VTAGCWGTKGRHNGGSRVCRRNRPLPPSRKESTDKTRPALRRSHALQARRYWLIAIRSTPTCGGVRGRQQIAFSARSGTTHLSRYDLDMALYRVYETATGASGALPEMDPKGPPMASWFSFPAIGSTQRLIPWRSWCSPRRGDPSTLRSSEPSPPCGNIPTQVPSRRARRLPNLLPGEFFASAGKASIRGSQKPSNPGGQERDEREF